MTAIDRFFFRCMGYVLGFLASCGILQDIVYRTSSVLSRHGWPCFDLFVAWASVALIIEGACRHD